MASVSILKKNNNIDTTTGPIWNKMLSFFIPILISSLVTRLFHVMDVAVIGNFAGKNELAAMGGGVSAIYSFALCFANSMGIGVNIVISQLIGARKYKTASKAIHNTVLFSLISGAALAIIGFFLSDYALMLLKTPKEIMPLSSTYLKIVFLAEPFTILFTLGTVILRAKGNSKGPLIISFVAAFVNLGLDLLFVAVYKMGVAGVALATAISKIITGIFTFYLLCKDNDELKLKISKLKPDKYIISRIVKLSMANCLYGVVCPLTDLCNSWAYNMLGSSYMASASVASTLETLSFSITAAFTTTTITFVGQNYGAGKIDRCRKSLYLGVFYSTVITYIIDIIILVFNHQTIGLITKDVTVIEITTRRLFYICIGHFPLIVRDLYTSALSGYGRSIVPSFISILGICLFRIIWIFAIFAPQRTYDAMLPMYPVSFVITAIMIYIYYLKINKEISMKFKLKEKL